VPVPRFVLRRLVSSVLVLLLIGYLSFLAQAFAAGTRAGSPLPVAEALRVAATDTADLVQDVVRGKWATYDAGSRRYYVPSVARPMDEIMGPLLVNSIALLVLAMLVGGLAGGTIGVAAAAVRRPGFSLTLVTLSIVGISTPSFFLGMLLQYLEITFFKTTGIRLVPVGGFGWDEHLVLPVLVLAARPIAQVARLTYVCVSETLEEDYVRTAHAKGLTPRGVWGIHIAPNVATTVLTAMGTSLRFSLSSLPVVEYMFGWPGAGRTMLTMLRTGQVAGATTLVMAMGAFFIAVNLILDLVYRAADPRLRNDTADTRSRSGWWEWVRGLVSGFFRTLAPQRRVAPDADLSAAALRAVAPHTTETHTDAREAETAAAAAAARRQARRRAWLQATAGNPALLLGAVIGLVLVALVVVGPHLAPRDPYAFSSMIEVEGRLVLPPVPPSDMFPLGSDAQGRDVLSLLLAGARRTLTIAFFAVAARLVLGGFLGFLAGWFAGSRLDRAIMGLAETMAAFPALLLAMLVVYAVGVRQGLPAFVVALAIVGWGEVMQMVRSQVMAIRPTAYVEGAIAAGASEGRILSAHVLPNVWPTMVSLAFLEMGGALMILGELGFLGVFIGGGFAAEGEAMPSVVYYDVPEWSVMLANSWRQFRSYPWATLYPALAFFIAIAGFTFLGEGLRRLTERLTLSLRTLFNRYTFASAVLLVVGVQWMFQSTGLPARFAPLAEAFATERAMAGIEHLASPAMNGRLSGTEDAERAAEWIASEFERLGLQPAGQDGTYYQSIVEHYRDLAGPPSLTLYGPDGAVIEAQYGRDYVLNVAHYDVGGAASGEVVLIAERPGYVFAPETVASTFGISLQDLVRDDRLVLRLAPAATDNLAHVGHSALLTLTRDPMAASRYELLGSAPQAVGTHRPSLLVSDELVSRLLATGGHTLEEMEQRIPRSSSEPALYYPTGWTAELDVPFVQNDAAEVRNVIAYWPGEDVALDAEVIIVTAYYDGLGRGPDGALYPGANDNASGIASMLETIRTLKQQGFRPKRTLLFAAWIGGERQRPVDYARYVRAHPHFADAYTVVAGLALEGVGAGTGSSAVLQHATSERLTEYLQRAARQVRTPLSTNALGLHADAQLYPAPSADVASTTISWAGADELAHAAMDTPEAIDRDKLGQVGRMVSLAVMLLASDPAY
jgi:ABC-type dipeptide/oligopeptide/nickel transport system permease subunit